MLRKSKIPKWLSPMLATLTKNYFSDPNWIYEHKLDGMRCLVFKHGNSVDLYSRNKVKQNDVFPELVKVFTSYPGDFILDGEIVAFKGKNTSFEQLQERMHVQNPSKLLLKKFPVVFYAFDLLYLQDYNICNLPLIQRKQLLLQNFNFKEPLRHLKYKVEEGEKYLAYAAKQGWEGIIAKLATSKYEHKRSRNWLKFKCTNQQEFVVGGYTTGKREHFGALLLGLYKDKKFIYAGKVGTGFDAELLQTLFDKLNVHVQLSSPFADYSVNSKSIHWVTPKLIVEIEFTEWTADGKLRHPSFIGIRTDKNPKDVGIN